jgi:hypothetical protein
MFFRKRAERKAAKEILELLNLTMSLVNPNHWPTPLDARGVPQPILVSINSAIRADREERFFPIEYEDLVAAVRRYYEAGLMERRMERAAALDPVWARCSHRRFTST